MDKLMYIAMTGARDNAQAQTIHANNLANVSTDGFRADFARARSISIFGETLPTRAFSIAEVPGTNFQPGTLNETGRDLDLAIAGDGFMVIDDGTGEEAYTRAGSLLVDALGTLRTANGHVVMGEGGIVSLPPFEKIEIGSDGTISIRGSGQGPEALTQVDRIKLVNPAPADIEKGLDGLIRRKDGRIGVPAAEVRLAAGYLESSNVNAVSALTEILSLSRQFELQIKMIRTAEENDEAAARLMQIS